jgi:hypothetical protein
MTLVGIVAVVALGAAWLFRRELVQFVLAAAAVFPQTAGIVVGENGFPVFYLAVATAAVLSAPQLLLAIAHPRGREDGTRPPRTTAEIAAVALVVWAAVIGFAGPRIFAGMPVFDPARGVDEQVGNLSALAPSLGNAAQVGYLLLAVLFLLMAGRAFPVDRRVVGATVWLAVVLADVRLVAGGAWPTELLQNMPGFPYQNGARLAGTFYEPSVLGMYLTAAAAYFVAVVLTGRRRVPAVIGLALVVVGVVANGSGTAVAALAVTAALGAAVLFVRGVRRRGVTVRPMLIAGSLAAAAVAISQLPALIAVTVGVVASKAESFSFVARNATNVRAAEIVVETLGLGVGLGGNRPSSLVLFVLSCLGILGFALAAVLVGLAVMRASEGREYPLIWALTGGLVAAAVAVPDLSTPLIWVAIGACLTRHATRVPAAPGVPETSVPAGAALPGRR